VDRVADGPQAQAKASSQFIPCPLSDWVHINPVASSVTVPLPLSTKLFGDPGRLQQLFENLLSNSLKYTDPGGKLDIGLEMTDNMVTIIWQDSAPGVGPAQIKRLFDRLYRVESSRSRASGGAGLGLAICKNIVEAHEGTIETEPSGLGGVLIKIRLPLAGKEHE